MKTKVIFKVDNTGSVFAFFPEMDYNIALYGRDIKVCYAHLGQHSSCSVAYADECSEAEYNQYYDLLKELIVVGYKLKVLNKQEIELWRKPTANEISFGEGAIHYRNFRIGKLLNKYGDIKYWIKAKDDGLVYVTR